jgi:hypothetical protein
MLFVLGDSRTYNLNYAQVTVMSNAACAQYYGAFVISSTICASQDSKFTCLVTDWKF